MGIRILLHLFVGNRFYNQIVGPQTVATNHRMTTVASDFEQYTKGKKRLTKVYKNSIILT